MSRLALVLTALVGWFAPCADAAVSTWVAGGSTSNFSDNLNWDSPPANGNDLVFPAGSAFAAKGSPVNDLNALAVGAINIYEAYSITGNGLSCTSINDNNATTATLGIPLSTAGTAVMTVIVTSAGGILNLPGIISGMGPVTYGGPGIKKLNGVSNNPVQGLTTLDMGSMHIWTSQTASPVSVTDGTLTLAQDCTVNDVTIGGGANGVLSLNETLASLSMHATCANLTIGAGSLYQVVVKGTGSSVYSNISAGSVTLTGAMLSVDTSNFTPPAGTVLTIIHNTGALTGTFSGLAEGATMVSSTTPPSSFTISYLGGTGHDVTLTAQTGNGAGTAGGSTTTTGTATGTGTATATGTGTATATGTATSSGTGGTPVGTSSGGGCGIGAGGMGMIGLALVLAYRGRRT